jgi:hypothetical protein
MMVPLIHITPEAARDMMEHSERPRTVRVESGTFMSRTNNALVKSALPLRYV